MELNRQPLFVRPGEGQTLLDLTCRVTSASTHGAYCAFDFVTLPGEGVPLHVHAREDELYYILEGTYEIECNGSKFTADACRPFPRRFKASNKRRLARCI
jgi:mannose-6-phosphate isomerase-like protein (cupin superfamily)